MNWNGVLALFCFATVITNVAGTCADLPQVYREKTWYFGYGNQGTIRNYRFTNTSIQEFSGSDSMISSLTCDSINTVSNTIWILAETRDANNNNAIVKWCFEIHDAGGETTGVLLIKRAIVNAQMVTSGTVCKTALDAQTTLDLQIVVDIDLNDVQNNGGFNAVLDAAVCTGDFPDAYDRNLVRYMNGFWPDAYLDSEKLKTTYTYNPDAGAINGGVRCASSSSSNIFVRTGANVRDTITAQVCEAADLPISYYRPLSGGRGEWVCVGSLNGNTIGAASPTNSNANVQIVAIEDGNVWYFACIRVVTDGNCVKYSIQLTDRDNPVCSVVYGPGNTPVDETVSWRDPNDATRGFISFESCSVDCAEDRCFHEVNCTQALGSFDCGKYNAVEDTYDCPADLKGVACEVEEVQCDSNPCQNNGICQEDTSADYETRGYTCNCQNGFKGTHCEIDTCFLPNQIRDTYHNKFITDVTVNSISLLDINDHDTIIETAPDGSATITYLCEFEETINGIYTTSLLVEGTAPNEERICMQIIQVTQQLPDGSAGSRFLLVRMTAPQPISPAFEPTAQRCGFTVADEFQVMFPSSLTPGGYVSVAPFPVGDKYRVEWHWANVLHCEDMYDSEATVSLNTVNLGSACDAQGSPAILPIGDTFSVVHYWSAGEWGGTGNVMLVAATLSTDPDAAPTYYCAYYEYDSANTPTIHISMYVLNEFAPLCPVNGNAQQTGSNFLYIKLISNECNGGSGNTNCLVSAGGVCTDSPNQDYTCVCPSGYRFDNPTKRCVDIDDCNPNPCHPEGSSGCSDRVNGFTCACNAGWSSDLTAPEAEQICNIQDFCNSPPEPCRNGGMCVNIPRTQSSSNIDTARGYRCDCVLGWIDGPLAVCEVDRNECLSNPCQNGGACREDDVNNMFRLNYYRCACPEGFTGTHCETIRNNCEPNNPCLNDGICINYPEEDGRIYCDCTETDYIWGFCEHLNECKTMPCNAENTISCEDRWGERVCHCKEGFRGGQMSDGRPPAAPYDDCSEPDTSNPCYTRPCMNNGVCSPHATEAEQFVCTCRGRWTGPTCEERVVTCEDNPCPSGIACTPVTNGTLAYQCDCPSHLSGPNCTQEDDGLGIVEQVLIGILCALIFGCVILAVCLVCGQNTGVCGPKGGCCP